MKIVAWLIFAVVFASTLAAPLWICIGNQLDCELWAQSWEVLFDDEDHDIAVTARLVAVKNSIAAKTQVATELASGQVTLRAAASRIRRLHLQRADFNWTAFRQLYHGNSDGERYAREALESVRAVLEVPPGRTPAVIAQLEAELSDNLARHGTVPLDPDVGKDDAGVREGPPPGK
jgi:hypothetical protein